MTDRAEYKLGELAERLRTSTEVLAKAAPDVAEAVKHVLTQTISAQRDPYGNAWPLTQQGKPALVNAARALTYRIVGRLRIRFSVKGHHGLHNKGRALGRVRRQMTPSKDRGLVTPAIRDAIDTALLYHATEHYKV